MATEKQKKLVKKLSAEKKLKHLHFLSGIILAKKNSIYLVKCNEFYKIGHAYDVIARFNNIKGANPYFVELIASKEFDDVKKMEEQLHEQYKNKKIKNEWFKLSIEDVIEIIKLLE